MVTNNKILILTSGNVDKLEEFKNFENVVVGSFLDINYNSDSNDLKFKETSLKEFQVIYFRLVGKSLEIATLVANFALRNDIKLVDKLYSNTLLMPISLAKSIEMRKLYESGISIPRTVFGDFSSMQFPYIVKSTSGQKAKEVWLVKTLEELDTLKSTKFEKGKYYFAQALVPNARRIRALIVGDNVIGAIVRHTKWNKDHTKQTLMPVPEDVANLARSAAKAVGLNISGVDILVNSETNEMFVIEANAAPAWKLINKYCNVSVADEIIKYLQTKI
ncbi:MAG: alpha-L-glutamate ligase [uncultured bacterium]|nr:MAG: alpha-L-glutamate ligase [uncultured bacterium]